MGEGRRGLFHDEPFQAQRPHTPPTDVFDIFRREFDAAYEDGAIFQLTCHPHIIGHRSRIWILDELIRHAKAKKGVWFATMKMWCAGPRRIPISV
jgi:peptidoglycan/xylan/chitin deacetylase (PgdA/CDA1 family)